MTKDVSYCPNSLFCQCSENDGHTATYCNSCGANLLVGERYRLIRPLQKENTDTDRRVFEALDTQNNDNPVVLKIVDFPNKKLAAYLEREYQFLKTAPPPFPRAKEGDYFEWCPNPEHDFYIIYVLVLNKVEGIDSEDWIKLNGPISELQCIEWMLEILEYLEAFADIPAIYRDMKPDNIMVLPDQHLQLIDFGSVRIIDKEYLAILNSNIYNEDGSDIRRGTRFFTFAYTPSEQLRGQAVPQSDFYAFGKTIIYWLTGRSPLDLSDDNKVDLAKYRPDISKTLIYFIDWLTEPDAGARPMSAKAIVSYLENDYPFLVETEENSASHRKKRIRSAIKIGFGCLTLAVTLWFGVQRFFYEQGKDSLNVREYIRAFQDFEIAQKMAPWSIAPLRQKGFACIGLRDWKCAEKIYLKILKNSPNEASALYQLGYVYEQIDAKDKAKELYLQSLEAQPLQVESNLRLARLGIESKNYLEAKANLLEVSSKMQDNPDRIVQTDKGLLNYYQGWLALEQSNYEVAEFHLKKSLESLSSDNEVSVGFADIYCLLAKARSNNQRASSVLLATWSGCLSGTIRTREGILVRENKIRSFLNNSLK